MANIIFFNAKDASGGTDLWETDGTPSGTFAIGGVDDAGVDDANTSGLNPDSITVMGDELLFGGSDNYGEDSEDENGLYTLWVSNGTAPGTQEVGGLANGGVSGTLAYPLGFYVPRDFIAFGNEALFTGADTNDYYGLWVTNGKGAGTVEIGGLGNAGIQGKYANGWGPTDYTAAGDEVFFNAKDAYNYSGLWITNGTTAGTVEVGGLDNAGVSGVSKNSFIPYDLTAFGDDVLFTSDDSTGYEGLWISDGSAAGTTEIAVGTEVVIGYPHRTEFDATDLTPVGNRVFFEALDSSAFAGLWVTDGTPAGTYEVGGVKDANVSGISYGLDPVNIAAFGDRAVFSGFDADNLNSPTVLWVSDGTASGTYEIGGLNNAGVNGAAATRGLDPEAFGSVGSLVLFTGEDRSGDHCLWVTDGTADGTTEIGGLNNAGVAGANVEGLDPTSFVVSGQEAYFVAEDASGDDALWVSNGTLAGTYEISTGASAPDPSDLVSDAKTSTPFVLPKDDKTLAYKPSYEAVWTPASGVLKIVDTAISNAAVATFNDPGPTLSGEFVTLSSDGGAGTNIGVSAYPFVSVASGDVVVSAISGQAYSAYELFYQGRVYQGVDYFFPHVTGQAYSSYQYEYSAGADYIGSRFFFTGISNQNYHGEEIDYDGGGNVTRVAFTDDTFDPFSAYEYDYVGGEFSGSQFTYDDRPTGAAYSSYEVDYDQNNNFIGDKFFFSDLPGQSYANEEEDFDADGRLSRVLLNGVTGQAYSSLEEDFNAGTYAGYKAYYAITGQSFSNEEVDVSAGNAITEVIYSGLSGTPYSSVEQDYSNGALEDVVYSFTKVSGASAYAYQVTDNASGAALQETFDNSNGSHRIIGLSDNQTLTSIGNDTMTGGGSGATFLLDAVYGHDTITDFSKYATGASHDTISLASSEFANFAAVQAAATNSGSGVLIRAADGDTLTLQNLTTTTLGGLGADFVFHS